MRNHTTTLLSSTAMFLMLAASVMETAKGQSAPAKLTLKNTQHLERMSPLLHASYLKPTGLEMIKGSGYTESTGSTILIKPGEEFTPNALRSPDNGRTWTLLPANPPFDGKLPHGYRRESFPLFVDPVNGNIVKVVPSLDTPGLDPTIVEPPVALEAYYLRYRVSVDQGKTFLFDESIVQKGKTPENPFEGVYRGKNGIFMGDVGSQLLRTRQGRILIPAQACKLGPDGKLWSPGGGFTYTDVIVILGRWIEGNRLEWEISQPIEADPARSTRGMIEPTIAELPDGRLLCAMRGSNGGSKDPKFEIPSYRWFSVSGDGGFTWTKPEPWSYDDGAAFFSPSAMSQLMKHSSGRLFWIGNISPQNCQGNNPRYPLVIGQVDTGTLRLIKSTLLRIDTKRTDEPGVNLSHWWSFEDRETGDIVVAGARFSPDYNKTSPVVYRIGVEAKAL
ncbi:MAG: exo-alpha-sialidase [Pirellulales bacterium]|nr:exo-alpha-sialidase [Pirellulales bacterium]